ncbi:hypothetical protein WJ972_14535 [Achromobacter insuavis]
MKTYRVGLLIDGTDQPGWIHDMAEWLARSQDFELSALLVMEKDTADRAPRLGAKALFGTLSRLESRLLPARQRQMLTCRDLRDGLSASTAVLTLPAGPRDSGRDDGVAALGLDLVIMLGAPAAAAREWRAGRATAPGGSVIPTSPCPPAATRVSGRSTSARITPR